MKLKFDNEGIKRRQPDPFIFQDEDIFYLYVTAINGVEAYSSSDIFGIWKYQGVVTNVLGNNYWAPSVIKYNNKFYMYVSFTKEIIKEDGSIEKCFEFMHVLSSNSPLGPFENEKELYNHFSIDSHIVQTQSGLFLWYAKNSKEGERIGTRIFVDKMLDPYTPANKPVEKVVPTFNEEIFTPSYREDNKWHTIEGPFWFKEGQWQYVMYSGGCFEDDSYHIGYAKAKSQETDLTKVEFEKHTNNGKFDPVLIKNDIEEGTGHHSVIKLNNQYYAIYHARDYMDEKLKETEQRTARICKLKVKDGVITAIPII